MAIVGDAYVVVRAVTTGVEDDIARAFSGAKGIGADAGDESGSAFARAFNNSSSRGGTLTKFEKNAENASVKLNKLIRTGYALGPAISGAVGAIGALATGLFMLGQSLGAAVPALILIPSLMSTLINSAVALKLAFKGVGNAIKLGLKPSKESGDAAKKAIRDAEQGVQKAKEALARTETQQAEALSTKFARTLDLMALGDRSAAHVGVPVERVRLQTIAIVGLLASSAVAATGIIAFVGLIVPHILRLVLGPKHRDLLWSSALLGAIVTLLADLAARTLLAPAELPLGVLTALIGAPFFLWLLRKMRTSESTWS